MEEEGRGPRARNSLLWSPQPDHFTARSPDIFLAIGAWIPWHGAQSNKRH